MSYRCCPKPGAARSCGGYSVPSLWTEIRGISRQSRTKGPSKKPVKLQGTVTKMEWINPRAWIYLDVKNTDGTVTNWMVEAGAPNALLRRGWTKNSLLPGTEILVEGYQAKDGANRANGRDITFKDGKKLFVGSSGT